MTNWNPPFTLYFAGTGRAAPPYSNDTSRPAGPARILIKRTLAGCGTLYYRKKRFEIPPNHMFVIDRPGPFVYCCESGFWEFEFISIAFENPCGLLPRKLREHPVICLDNHHQLQEDVSGLIRLRSSEDYEPALSDSMLAARVFFDYITLRRELAMPRLHPETARVRREINQHFAEDISVVELCSKNGYSHETVSRLFKKQTGKTPVSCLQSVRIRSACSLLEKNTLPIKRIAPKCGFPDVNYFTRVFRTKTGMTPAAYRKNPDPLIRAAL